MEGVKNFTNISDKKFVGMYGGDRATVPAGKTVAFTEIVANHLAGQLAERILIDKGKPWTDKGSKGERSRLVAEILGGDATGVRADGTVGIIKPFKAIKTPSKGKSVDADEAPEETEAPKEGGEFEDLPEEEEGQETAKDDKDDLQSKSYAELKEMAKKRKISMKGLGNSKSKLIRALSK